MAKDISLLGATYPDVPEVDLPLSGGGTARFIERDETALVVTLSWDSNYGDDGGWVPACTWAEISAAYAAEREIVCSLDISDPDRVPGGSLIWVDGDGGGGIGTAYFTVFWEDWSEDYGGTMVDTYSWWFDGDEPNYGLDYRGPVISPNFESPTRTYTPTEQQQSETITYDQNEGYNGIEQVDVTVNAIPSNYVGSGITRRSGSDLTASGDTVSVPAGYYASAASKAVASGSATASATKGSVSNHSVQVTPSVTRTAGYISAGSANGQPVTVQASELVSGSQTVTANGTVDVTTLAEVVVAVEGGSGLKIGTATATPSSASQSISFTGLQGEPTSFHVVAGGNLSTASQAKTAAVIFDGTSLHGQTVTNTSNAQASYVSTGWSKSYSNGTLTITGTSYWQNVEYTLVYTYGGSSANLGTEDVQVGSGATSISFTGLSEEPSCWSVIFKGDFGTSSSYQRVMAISYDGSTIGGMALGSQGVAESSWTQSYSNGTLTIASQSTTAGGYFHQPGYYQLTYATGGEAPPIEVEPLSVTTNGTYTAPRGTAYSPVTVNVPTGGGVNIDVKTLTNNSNTATSLSFTSMKGTPKAFFLRCTAQIDSSSSTYYYCIAMRYDGDSTTGNYFRLGSTRRVANVTSGYSYSYSGTTLTVSSSGSRTASPGSFYNGAYELVYVY